MASDAMRIITLRQRMDQLNVPEHSHRLHGAFRDTKRHGLTATISLYDLEFLVAAAENQVTEDDNQDEIDRKVAEHEQWLASEGADHLFRE